MASSSISSFSSSVANQLPVFVFPHSLNFYADDASSFKQVLSLYNPYEFTVKFRVLCTAPKKYTVVDPEGIIRSRCCVDIVIRCNEINAENYNKTDQFRVEMVDYETTKSNRSCGKRDVSATLFPVKSSNPSPSFAKFSRDAKLNNDVKNYSFDNLQSDDERLKERKRNERYSSQSSSSSSSTNLALPSWTYVTAAIVCLIVITLPNEGDSSFLPNYLHIKANVKLAAAYALGLLTMALLR